MTHSIFDLKHSLEFLDVLLDILKDDKVDRGLKLTIRGKKNALETPWVRLTCLGVQRTCVTDVQREGKVSIASLTPPPPFRSFTTAT